ETWLVIEVGSAIGALATAAWLLGDVFLGLFFIRQQALAILFDPEKLLREERPEQALFDAPMLALGGLLLILPGFLSDVLGILLLLPWLRRKVASRWLERVMPVGSSAQQRPGHVGDDGVIEGEFIVIRDRDDDRPLPPR
ncbi:MAG: FxsA family protein, partial [Gammaproteobacteria bacterium]